MKICVIGNGQSVHVIRYIELLEKIGMNPVLISPQKHNLKIDSLTVPNYYVKNIVHKMGIVKNILKFIKTNDVDIVHFQFFSAPSIEALFIKKPQIATVWGGDIFINERFTGNRIIKKVKAMFMALYFRRIETITTHSKFVMNYLCDVYKISPKKITLLPFVTNQPDTSTDFQFDFEKRWKNKKIILSPRAIKPIYNTVSIVEAFGKLPNDYVLILKDYADDKAYIKKTQEAISERNLSDRVLFLKDISEEENRHLTNLASVVISLASSDMISISIIEAIQSFKKIILLSTPSYAQEMSDIKSIVIHDTLNPEKIAESVLTLDTLDIDKPFYENVIRFYDETHTISSIKDIYRNATDKSN